MKAVETPIQPLRNAPLWPLSVEAYRALGEAGLIPKNTELLYGFIYRKISKSPLHSYLVLRLIRLLQQILPARLSIRSEQPISCGDSEPEPDVAVVAGNEGDYWTAHPRTAELVVEVCVSSHEYDRSKLRAYANAGVKECWLVLGPEKQIEVHRLPSGDAFSERTVYRPGAKLTCAALPEFTLELDTFFSK